MRTLVVLGLVFLGVAAVLAIADANGMSRRMPTQVPPRWVAVIPLGAGMVLLAAGLGWFVFEAV